MGINEDMMNHQEPDEFDEDFEDIGRGIIRGIEGSYMSGLATLIIENEHGMFHYISCNNSPIVRALEDAFGNVIGESHNIKPNGGHIGQDVFYMVDAFGVLEWFLPVREAPEDFLQYYYKNKGDEFVLHNMGM